MEERGQVSDGSIYGEAECQRLVRGCGDLFSLMRDHTGLPSGFCERSLWCRVCCHGMFAACVFGLAAAHIILLITDAG